LNATTTSHEAPGSGFWSRDPSHMSEPPSLSTAELLFPAFESGHASGFARYGSLLERLQTAGVDGWMYVRARPVGAPEKPGATPPRLAFKLLLRLHPALRRRARAARSAIAAELWRRDAEDCFSARREALIRRLRELQNRDVASMDDAALTQHLRDVHAITVEALETHFQHITAHMLGIGDWLAHVLRWTGAASDEAMAALRGASPFSLETLLHLDRIADALEASPEALSILDRSLPPQEALQQLREVSPPLAEALDGYLAEQGVWITGFDIDKPMLRELPDALLSSITSHMARRNLDAPDASADTLRERVPEPERALYDRLFETARLTYQLRDSDAGPTAHWPGGLLRIARLEAARRLLQRGAMTRPEQVFETRLSELEAMLLGTPGAPSAEELEERIRQRDESRAHPPPLALGEPEGPPPPDEWLPEPLRRIAVASAFGGGAVFGRPSAGEETPDTLRGVAASQGQHEGRTCLVMGPEDFDKLQPGDVLIAPFTTPVYNVVLPMLGGIVTDHGGLLSHAAIVAREYGIPSVVATGDATSRILHGSQVRVDGSEGLVTILAAPRIEAGAPVVNSAKR
jgi:phosphohistidine swiveling domain-containing protein